MLRVSKLADYGTVVMVHFARHPDELLNAKDIANGIHLALPTASKLLKILVNQGLLDSMRGSQGGYRLAKPAAEISVAEIIQAIEGSQGLTECSQETGGCALEAVCEISGNWQLISRAIHAALDSVSLAALARPVMQVSNVDISTITRINSGSHESREVQCCERINE